MAIRGPLFGVVAQDADDGQRWRVVVSVSSGFPQMARDSLISRLWFRARDEADHAQHAQPAPAHQRVRRMCRSGRGPSHWPAEHITQHVRTIMSGSIAELEAAAPDGHSRTGR